MAYRLTAVFILLCSSLFARELKIVGKEFWPYSSEYSKKKAGYAVDIVRYIFAQKGYSIQYETMPWPRALLSTSLNAHNAIICIHHSKEHNEKFIFPRYSVGMTGNAFFTLRKNEWYYRGLPSLQNQTVGIIKDYAYGFELENYFDQNQNDIDKIQLSMGVDALEKNIKMLMMGRIDVLFDDVNAVMGTAMKMGVASHIKAVGFDNTSAIYVAFSKKHPHAQELADLFDAGMKQMRSNGKLEKILLRYNMEDWQ